MTTAAKLTVKAVAAMTYPALRALYVSREYDYLSERMKAEVRRAMIAKKP